MAKTARIRHTACAGYGPTARGLCLHSKEVFRAAGHFNIDDFPRCRSGGDPGQPEGRTIAAQPSPISWPVCSRSKASRSKCSPIWPRPPRRPTAGTPKDVCGCWSESAATARPPNWSTAPTTAFRLTLLPAGNSNLLAVYYRLSKDPEQICQVITEGIAARIDAGLANGRVFLLMIGCGFDAAVVNLVHGAGPATSASRTTSSRLPKLCGTTNTRSLSPLGRR